jgi:hypothetical protein
MRLLFTGLLVATATVLALPALADPPKDKGKGNEARKAEMKEQMLKEFDADKDGKLSDEEKAKVKEKMRERRAKREGEKGARGEKRRRDGGRGPEARRRPGGPGGPPHIPEPAELFKKFDKDSDQKLTRDEFLELASYVKEHMPRPPMGRPPGGPGFRGRGGPDGPPPGERGEFRRRRPGPDGGPPPRGEGRRPRDRGDRRPDGERGPRPDGPPPKGGEGDADEAI